MIQAPSPKVRWGGLLLVSLLALFIGESSAFSQPPLHPEKLFDQRSRPLTLGRTETLLDPAVYLRKPGESSITLCVQMAENTLYLERFHDGKIDQVRLKHRSYDGGLCGRIIRVQPGDILNVRLVNNLPEDEPVHGMGGMGHRLNTTNLHTHGLFVSPSGRSDNVYLDVRPGEVFQYRFEIPKDHPSGTFWYHAHLHGSVAFQLASGMAGALIVEGKLDEELTRAGISEKILLFQQFVFHRRPDGRPAEVDPGDFYGTPGPGTEAKTTVNGQVTPEILMRPGEIQRWRMIHAGIWETIDLSIEGHALLEFATDGLTTGRLDKQQVVQLQPGNRSDVLIQASNTPGTYLIRSQVVDRAKAIRGRLVPETFVAKLVIQGEAVQTQLPAPELFARHRPKELEPIDESEVSQRRVFTLVGEDGPPARFLMDGLPFDPNPPDILRVRVDTAEEWTIRSEVGGHPFHPHVNSFEVLTKNDRTGKLERAWRDTVFVPAGRSVTIRTRFRRYTGKTVMHCHILDHEDKGMMKAFEIVPRDAPASPEAQAARALPQATLVRRGVDEPPAQSPSWDLADAFCKRLRAKELAGKPYLLVLHLGIGCPHCARQLLLLGKDREAFAIAGVEIVTVSSVAATRDQVEDLRRRYGLSLPVLADPKLTLFEQLRCLDSGRKPLHGTFLIDAGGTIRFRSVGAEPETDMKLLLGEVGKLRSGK